MVALGAMAISWAAPLVKVIEAPPSTIGYYRLLFAALSLIPVACVAIARMERRPSYRPLLWAAFSGLMFGFDLSMFHRAILMTGAGLATLLANTQIFWVALISSALLNEKPPGKFWAYAGLAIAGVALLTAPGLVNQTLDPLGILYGLVTALFYAAYILSLRQCQSQADSWPISVNLAVSCAVGALTLFTLTGFTGENTDFPNLENFIWLIILGLVVHVGGWAFISRGMPYLPARVSSITILLQPVLTTVWGVAFFAERFGWLDALGALLTLAAIYAVALASRPDN